MFGPPRVPLTEWVFCVVLIFLGVEPCGLSNTDHFHEEAIDVLLKQLHYKNV